MWGLNSARIRPRRLPVNHLAQMSSALDRFALAATAFGAGVVVGLMLAPEPGDAARARVVGSARDAADAARRGTRDLADPVARTVTEAARHLADRHVPLADDFDVIDGRDLPDDLAPGRD